MGRFRELKVWQKSKSLAVEIYKLTSEKTWERDYRFKQQIRAAAISIPSNIAEGDESGSNKNSIRYFYISKGSCAEILTQIEIATELSLISKKKSDKLIDDYEHIRAMIINLIKSREE